MASPFPGMDPYLEQSAFWSSFHTRLMVKMAEAIMPLIEPKYYIEVETRTYMDTPEGELLVGIPDAVILSDAKGERPEKEDSIVSEGTVALKRPPVAVTLPMPVEVKERYLEIREVQNDRVVTVIELLSPANKKKGRSRDKYETKRLDVLGSSSHLVEIDLLRGHPPLPINSNQTLLDYYILVSVAEQRPKAQLYPFTIRESLPVFLMPLKSMDEMVPVDMQDIFQTVIATARYDSRIDYTKPVPPPKLSQIDSAVPKFS